MHIFHFLFTFFNKLKPPEKNQYGLYIVYGVYLQAQAHSLT